MSRFGTTPEINYFNLQVKKLAGLGSFISQGPMFTKGGEMILGIKDQIHVFDFTTGTRKWEQETDKDIKALVYSPIYNSLPTKDFKFLTAQSEDGTKKSIYMIEKATGKIVKEIPLTDKDPGHEIDEVYNLIFVNEKNRTVTAYKM